MPFYQTTSDPGGGCAFSRWDDDAHPVVPTSPHRAASGVDHKADQEPEVGNTKEEKIVEKKKTKTGEAERIWKKGCNT